MQFWESILAGRRAIISRLLDIQYSRVDRHEAAFAKDGSNCSFSGHVRLECDILSYGSLIRHLLRVGLWPRKAPEQVDCTVDTLIKALRFDPWAKHYICRVYEFEAKVKDLLSCVPSPVLDSHRQHFKAQKSSLPFWIKAKHYCSRGEEHWDISVGCRTPEISDYTMLFQLRSNISWQFQLQGLWLQRLKYSPFFYFAIASVIVTSFPSLHLPVTPTVSLNLFVHMSKGQGKFHIL